MTKAIRYLDGPRLHRGLHAGIARLVSRREYLDRINVFPVPDGDTGTNLAFTLLAISNRSGTRLGSISEVMADAADAAIDGSRGNSGAIFAQFLQGVRESSEGRIRSDCAQFATDIEHGAKSAWDAVAKPREGTILSVLNDYAMELKRQIQAGVDDFAELHLHGLARARRSLAHTPDQLEVLRKAGVVDAGAQGFVDFLEGVSEFIHSGSIRELNRQIEIPARHDSELTGHDGELTYRYCVECRLTADPLDRNALRAAIEGLGDSLVIAATQTAARVHIHVDDPATLFRQTGVFGLVSDHKADDMLLQQRIAQHHGTRVAICTDTGADLPAEITARYPIYPVPLRVNFGQEEEIDKVSIAPAAFYDRLRAQPLRVRTSQPPVGDFRRAFDFLASHYDQVLSINLSGPLSGTCAAARTAAAEVRDTRVLDALNGAGGQGLLAIAAAEMADAGHSLEAIERHLTTLLPKTRTFAAVEDLSYAVRGGRVSPLKKRIVDLFGVTPVIGVTRTGLINTAGVLFGRRNIGMRLARLIARRLDHAQRWRIIVGHCDNAREAKACIDGLRALLPHIESLWEAEAGTAIGAHAGPGAVIVGAQPWNPVAEAAAGD